jgi:hypothetical protein
MRSRGGFRSWKKRSRRTPPDEEDWMALGLQCGPRETGTDPLDRGRPRVIPIVDSTPLCMSVRT